MSDRWQVLDIIELNMNDNYYHLSRYFPGATPCGGKCLAGFHICVNF